MRILEVMAGNDHGGAETAFVDMCLALHEAGVEIEVATRANAVRVPALEEAGITVHKLPFGGPVDVYTRWKLGRIIRAFRPTIVQTWMARAAQKTPNWASLRTPQRYLVVPRLGGYYKIRNFASADYFVAVTPDLKRHIIEGGIDESRVAMINNFAETDGDMTRPVQKSDFGLSLDTPVTVSLGRLHPSKAYDVLFDALTGLPGVHALIAGEGPSRAELEQLVSSLGIADRVHFLGWRTDRAALLRCADCCVFASRVEPFGTVFAQAWAERTPVIVSDAIGPRQFCRDGEDCLMVPVDDADALRGAIRRMLGDHELQSRVTENGYRRYREAFTKERAVASYLDYFSSCLAAEGIRSS